MARRKTPLCPPLKIDRETEALLAQALREDVGSGDVTSLAIIEKGQKGAGLIFAKEEGVLCGLEVARRVMQLVDPSARMRAMARDGESLQPKQEIARISGPLRSILTAERVMLNFLQRLSGTATLTRLHVDALRLAGSSMDVVDTRKTTPLWRVLERHAVRAGGGVNHRFALYDMYLVKNNHVDSAGGIDQALRRVWVHNPSHKIPVAVEARTIREVREILKAGDGDAPDVDLILLDNMTLGQMRRAAEIVNGRVRTEITGGVSLAGIRRLATVPVDRVSIGALTHSAPALDISLHID